MTNTLTRLLISFCFAIFIISCKQKPVISATADAYQHQIDSLIAKGKKIQSAHIDSLLPIAKKLNQLANLHSDKPAAIYSELFTAHYYWLSAEPQQSMEIAVKCLADAEKESLKLIYPDIYSLISNLHKENGNYKMAFEADAKGLDWAIANRDTISIIALLSLKAMLTHTHQLFLHSKTLNDTSINLQFSALKMAESSPKYESMRIRFYDNISQYYLDNKNYDKAIFYGNKGVALALKHNQPRSLTYAYSWLGEAYYYKGDKVKGLDYLNNALSISRSIKEPYRIMEIYSHLYDCYYSSGDYKKALAMLTISRDMRDSLQVSMNEKQISELQIKYESVKKDKKIVSMGHDEDVKNRLIMVILSGSLIFVIFSVLLFLQYRFISRNNRLISLSNEQKGKALENIAHIQSHELRKPLASIMGLINLIKAMDYELDKECILKLEEAGRELDAKIHAVLEHIDNEQVANNNNK